MTTEIIEEKNMVVEAITKAEGRLVLGILFTGGMMIALLERIVTPEQFIQIYGTGLIAIAAFFKREVTK